jgi:hypothetical protein
LKKLIRIILAVALVAVVCISSFAVVNVASRRGQRDWRGRGRQNGPHDCDEQEDNEDCCCCVPGTVFYLGKDTVTQGDWQNAVGSPIGVYGSYAHILPNPPRTGIEIPVGNFSVPVGGYTWTDYGWTSTQKAGLPWNRTDPPYWDEYVSLEPKINYTLNGTLHDMPDIGLIQWPVFEWGWDDFNSSDVRAAHFKTYVDPSGGPGTRLTCWDDGGERDGAFPGIDSEGYFNVTLEFPQGVFMLSLYAYDKERVQRPNQTITITNEEGAVLASGIMEGTEFDEGIYLQFVVCGPTTIIVTVQRGVESINAVLSGIFVDKLPCVKWCGRTIGFWKTNIGKQIGILRGRGWQVDIDDIREALDNIYDIYGWSWIPYGPNQDIEAWRLLNYRDPVTGRRMAWNPAIKAEAQALALLLTAEIYGGTTDPRMIEIYGYGCDTVWGWINQIVDEFNDAHPDYRFIYAVADYLNNLCT